MLQTYDLFFRAIFVFVIIDVESRRIVHVGITRHPTDFWLAQQLRDATPFGQAPRYLIHDRGSNFGETFAQVASSSGITILKTPYRVPKANAFVNALWAFCDENVSIIS